MAKIRYEADGEVSVARFVAALTDFSERRPELWPDMDAKFFRLRESIAASPRGRLVGVVVRLTGVGRFGRDLRETLARLSRLAG